MTSSIRVVLPPEVVEDEGIEHSLRSMLHRLVNLAAIEWEVSPLSANHFQVERTGTVGAPLEVYAVIPAGRKSGWFGAVREAIKEAITRKGLLVEDERLHISQSDPTGGGLEEE